MNRLTLARFSLPIRPELPEVSAILCKRPFWVSFARQLGFNLPKVPAAQCKLPIIAAIISNAEN
jgi:hypothetical protein